MGYCFWKIQTSFFLAVSADPPPGLTVAQPVLLLYHPHVVSTSFTGGEMGHQSKREALVTEEASGKGRIPLPHAHAVSSSRTAAMGEPQPRRAASASNAPRRGCAGSTSPEINK